jgi:integrase
VKRTTWKVYPVAPGARDVSWRMKAVPPPGSRGLRVVYQQAKGTTLEDVTAEGEAWERVVNATLILERDPTVGAVLLRHAAHRETDGKTRPRTVLAYREAAQALAPLLGDVRGSSLTRAHVLRAQDALASRLGAGSVNLHLSCAAHAWTWAHARELVAMAWPRVDRLPVKPTKKRPFTDREVARVLEWLRTDLRGRWFPFFALIADTGARVGELVALLGADLDHEACTVRILPENDKTDAGRTVAVPPETMALLPRVGPEERVFVPVRHAYRTRRVATMIPLRALRRALRGLGFQPAEAKRLDVHSFRRSFVATTVRLGVPLPVSMKATGHRSVKVHLDYQRAAVGDDMHDVAARVRASRTNLAVPGPKSCTQTIAAPTGPTSSRSRHDRGSTHAEPTPGASAPEPVCRALSTEVVRPLGTIWSGNGDPFGDELAGLAQRHPRAMWALVTCPVRVLTMQRALADALPSLHAPAAEPSPARRAGG